MSAETERAERLSELRQKFGREPLPPRQESLASTPREAQPRFRGLDSGHRACQGCGEALAARLVMESAIGLAGAMGAFAL